MLVRRFPTNYFALIIILGLSCNTLAQTTFPSSDELRTPRVVLDEALEDPIAIIGKPATKAIEEWRTGDGNRVTKVRTFWGSYCLTIPLSPPGFMRNDIGTNVAMPTNCPTQ